MRFESFWYTDLVQRFGVTLRVCFTALCPVVVPKKKLLFAFLILPACGPTLAIAADSQVFFGGFAFAGSSNDASRNFPLSSVLDTLNNDGTTYLGRATREFFIQNKDKFRGINLQFDSLVRKEDSQLVLALAMTDENVSREEFGDFHKLVIQLGFELLVLDFKELQVISSQPVYLEYVDTNKKPFDDAVVRHRIQEMITGDESQLFSVLLRKANRIQTWSKNQCTLQVKRVDIGKRLCLSCRKGFAQLPMSMLKPRRSNSVPCFRTKRAWLYCHTLKIN